MGGKQSKTNLGRTKILQKKKSLLTVQPWQSRCYLVKKKRNMEWNWMGKDAHSCALVINHRPPITASRQYKVVAETTLYVRVFNALCIVYIRTLQ
jgi:hypothetical protein